MVLNPQKDTDDNNDDDDDEDDNEEGRGEGISMEHGKN